MLANNILQCTHNTQCPGGVVSVQCLEDGALGVSLVVGSVGGGGGGGGSSGRGLCLGVLRDLQPTAAAATPRATHVRLHGDHLLSHHLHLSLEGLDELVSLVELLLEAFDLLLSLPHGSDLQWQCLLWWAGEGGSEM